MIKQNIENGLLHTFSDAGFFIVQTDTGIEYDEAWDIPTTTHTYEESDKKISDEEPSEGSSDLDKAWSIMMGEDVDD